jgi:hypothetical protein
VIAFSHAQMNCVLDEIDLRCREEPELQEYLLDDRLEGFFVKNLETVQGDERDVILFSVGYGRDARGKLTMNFGPLNQQGGEYRLNVAVTRAREKVVVVSSLRAHDLPPDACAAAGVLHLRHYLEYAEGEGSRFQGISVATDNGETGQPHSVLHTQYPLEDDIRHAIEELGYDVVPHVGTSTCRIDLGVLDPTRPGTFLLGIECDGRGYRAVATARDRDRLRHEVLEGLGWRIHRVWALDWFRQRNEEIERLRQALVSALRDPQTRTGGARTQSEPGPSRRVVVAMPGEGTPFPGTVPYRVCELTVRGEVAGGEFHDRAARPEQCRLLGRLVALEGPIHIDLVADRLRRAWGLSRVGDRIRQTVEEAAGICTTRKQISRRDEFLWPATLSETPVRVPDPSTPESYRDIGHIAPEELQAALRLLITQGVGIGEDDLLAQTARLLGFGRLGDLIRQRLRENLEELQRQGECVARGGAFTLAR